MQQQPQQLQQKIVAAPAGQQIIVNAAGQQLQLAGGQQVIQVNPATGGLVTSGGQLIVNQAGQVVQQRIVNSQGAIVAQGMVQGQVISSGFQNKNSAVAVQQPQQQIPLGQVIQRIVHPGGRVEEKVVGSTQGLQSQVILQQQPQQGQVTLQPQQQQQPQQVVVSSGGPVQVISGGQVIAASNTGSGSAPAQVISGGQTQVVRAASVPQQQAQRPANNEEMLENGMSVLDGILPKDPQFGVLDGDMVSELLEKSENNVVVNGAVHHADTTKMNGDISGGKRLLGEYVDNSPAKKQALEAGAGVVVTNGGHGNGSLNGSGMMPVAAAGGQLVRNSAGQIFLKTASASGGLVLQPAGGAGGQVMVQGGGQDSNGGQQKLVFLQQSQRPQHQQTVARVGVAAPAPPPGQAGDLPQVDGAGDCEGEEESSPVPQVDGSDGTTVEPATSTQQPADQQQQQQQQQPQS